MENDSDLIADKIKMSGIENQVKQGIDSSTVLQQINISYF